MELHQRNPRKNNKTNKGGSRQEARQKNLENQQPTNCDPTTGPTTRSIDFILSTTTTTTTKNNKKNRRFHRKSAIVNLSTYKLNRSEESLLEKGLNFIPTPHQEHEAKITQDFLLFEQKLRLYHKYHREQNLEDTEDESSENESPHKLHRPSEGYKPEDHEMDPNIMRFKTTILNQLRNELVERRKPRFNTSKMERRAMRSLKTNKKIIIKPADKGGAIVIQHLEDYIKEGERQLSNTTHYKQEA